MRTVSLQGALVGMIVTFVIGVRVGLVVAPETPCFGVDPQEVTGAWGGLGELMPPERYDDMPTCRDRTPPEETWTAPDVDWYWPRGVRLTSSVTCLSEFPEVDDHAVVGP